MLGDKEHEIKDLGVNMSNNATFSKHITKITVSARQLSGWILRTFQTRSVKCMLTFWKSVMLPQLVYCCQLWAPNKIWYYFTSSPEYSTEFRVILMAQLTGTAAISS